MSRRRKSADTTPFDTIRRGGSLFAPGQNGSDCAIPLGLKISNEYRRAFPIAVDFLRENISCTISRTSELITMSRANGFPPKLLPHCP